MLYTLYGQMWKQPEIWKHLWDWKKIFFSGDWGWGGVDFEEHMWINFLLHTDMRGQNFDI